MSDDATDTPSIPDEQSRAFGMAADASKGAARARAVGDHARAAFVQDAPASAPKAVMVARSPSASGASGVHGSGRVRGPATRAPPASVVAPAGKGPHRSAGRISASAAGSGLRPTGHSPAISTSGPAPQKIPGWNGKKRPTIRRIGVSHERSRRPTANEANGTEVTDEPACSRDDPFRTGGRENGVDHACAPQRPYPSPGSGQTGGGWVGGGFLARVGGQGR